MQIEEMEPVEKLEDIKPSKLERLEFIETLLLFRGWFSRKDLKEEFGSAPAVATRDIKTYKELLKNDECVYLEAQSKLYKLIPASFTPIFNRTSGKALKFLRQISKDKKLGAFNNINIEVPSKLVEAKFDVITSLTRAIFNNKCVEVSYFSSREGPKKRTIYPHAIFDGGLQWYVRAYDLEVNGDGSFTDLAISRISKISSSDNAADAEQLPFNDIQWNKYVRLEISAHPDMKHPEVIEFQYGMKDGVKELSVRAAIVGYWLNHWNIDCTKTHSLDPQRCQLWLSNPQTLYDVTSALIAPGYKLDKS
jgi:predicted DNA-binding transcriptional regulator YafY